MFSFRTQNLYGGGVWWLRAREHASISPSSLSFGQGRGIIPLGPPTGFTVSGKFSSLFNFYVAQARVFTVTLVSVTGIYRDFGSGHGWGIYRDFGAVL